MIKVTFESTEGECKRQFSIEFDDGVAWMTIMEDGILPGLRALNYELGNKDEIPDAMGWIK